MGTKIEELERRITEIDEAVKRQVADWLKELERRVASLEKGAAPVGATAAVLARFNQRITALEENVRKLVDVVYRLAQQVDPGLAQEVKREFP